MKRLIFDIETIGKDFESLDEHIQDYLLQRADTEEKEEEVKERLGLSPVTGEIVAIGLLDPDTMKGKVYFQAPRESPFLPFEENGIWYETGTEEEILNKFWIEIKDCDQVITFNGRSFDCPFILIRSALYRIKPSRELMPNRYSNSHTDLLDQLTFFGVTRKYSLDIWCRFFGIKSPKDEGITGVDVKELYKKGEYLEIARYCARDLLATRELFDYWDRFIRFKQD
jgi:DNA polymerase elongation subunit (family B)